MDDATVKTSRGMFRVRRPNLRGWRLVLGALPKDSVDDVLQIVATLSATPDISDDMDGDARTEAVEQVTGAFQKVGLQVFGLLPKAPDVACAVLCATLADPDSGALDLRMDEAEEFTEEDVVLTVRTLLDTGILQDMLDRIKNAFSRGKGTPGSSDSTE